MEPNLLTAGQFAKLARTTKRTVIWYDSGGILRPKTVNSEGYRFYDPEQIIDFQVILLLRKMGFSIEEIKDYLDKKHTLKDLFKVKEMVVKQEIKSLQQSLHDINSYYTNMAETKSLVRGTLKKMAPLEIYYIDRVGPYAEIEKYNDEMRTYFKRLPKNIKVFTIFIDHEYAPKRARMKLGIVKQKGLELKKDAEEIVKTETIPGYSALTYTHVGNTAILSLLWDELSKYRKNKGFKLDTSLPFWCLEFYLNRETYKDPNESDFITEIQLPVCP
jgi:DNA-binding transcriptional MerR regulator